MTAVRDLLSWATDRLARAGVPSPRYDAAELAAHVLGTDRGRLSLAPDLTAEQAERLRALVARRADREPLQHLTGHAGFRRLDLAVGPGVFVPRPETELLVEWCLERLPRGGTFVDLCAGSGAIALSVAVERPDVSVYAVEREPAAYAWLLRNADGRAGTCVRADIADLPEVRPDLVGRVHVVASNPPYIPLGARPLDPEVAEYDPPAALWGGADGLDVVRVVARVATDLLVPAGRLAVEHADTQGRSVPQLLRAAGYVDVADHRDLAGRDRFATGTRAPVDTAR